MSSKKKKNFPNWWPVCEAILYRLKLGGVEEVVAEAFEPERGEAVLPQVKEADTKAAAGAPRAKGNAPNGGLGVIDLSESPLFTDAIIHDAQVLKGRPTEGCQGVANPFDHFMEGLDSSASEDATGLGDLSAPKKSPSSETIEPSSSLKLISRFPTASADPGWKQTIIMSILEDAWVLLAPVGSQVIFCAW